MNEQEAREHMVGELHYTLTEIQELKESIKQDGRTYRKDGFVKPNPAVAMLKDAQRLLVSLCSKLNITPKKAESGSVVPDSFKEF